MFVDGRLAQLARALARQARGHWFESSIAHFVVPTNFEQKSRKGTRIQVPIIEARIDRLLARLQTNLRLNFSTPCRARV